MYIRAYVCTYMYVCYLIQNVSVLYIATLMYIRMYTVSTCVVLTLLGVH